MSLFAPLPEISLPKVENKAEISALVRERVLPLLPGSATLISVDGLDGSGKSSIGRAIAALSGRRLIELDEFLDKQQDRFLEALRTDHLQRELMSDEPTVIEGCLVKALLDRVGRQPDFRIYVVRTGQMHCDPEHEWCDEYELLMGSKSAADLIQEEETKLKAFCESGAFGLKSDNAEVSGLWKELVNYHREFAPHQSAELVVKVVRTL